MGTKHLLGCQYVDDVLIDAPYKITPDMITQLNISEIVCGTRHDDIGKRYVENMMVRLSQENWYLKSH